MNKLILSIFEIVNSFKGELTSSIFVDYTKLKCNRVSSAKLIQQISIEWPVSSPLICIKFKNAAIILFIVGDTRNRICYDNCSPASKFKFADFISYITPLAI